MRDTSHIEIDPHVRNHISRNPGEYYCYENVALDSSLAGHTVFLKCGPGCAFETPPTFAPDGSYGPGWKYRLVGKVNPETWGVEPYDEMGCESTLETLAKWEG